ncbi:MAG: hypothetical protein AUJ19_03925 [Parcubacteria group bacterium CG1_02_58_44]|nr:MAG: hypothetical protein AUJ19_03925 [Parcubacteria group bacterium CG1_02_58_44]
MGRDHSALSREVRRNRGRYGRYLAAEAHGRSVVRLAKRVRGRRLDRDPNLAAWVEGRLRAGWSPGKIAGRTASKLAPKELQGVTISHETTCRWLYEGGGKFGGLSKYLWTGRRRRFSHKGRKPKTSQIEGRIPISERPEDGLPGHLESDSMVWRSTKGLLSVQVDRVLKVCRLSWCPDRTAVETLHALRRTAETLPHRFVRSVAFDNGSEGSRHGVLGEEYGIPTYFCLPRKSLGYLTPNEALHQYLSGGATAT